MLEKQALLLRASAVFAIMMQRSAMRSGGTPIRMGLAGTVGVPGVVATDSEREDESKLSTELIADEVQHSDSVLTSLGEQVSFGGVLGFAAGYSIRTVGKAVLFLVGTEVVILQYMAYREWLTMDWRKLGRDIAPKFDKGVRAGLGEILVYKMPFSVAFSGGLVAGLRLSSKK